MRTCSSTNKMASSERSDASFSGKNRGKTWSVEATSALIDLWSEESIQLTLDNCKSSHESSKVYKTLQAQLNNRGYEGFELKEVINKMKKPRQRYKKEKDKKRKSGSSGGKQWKFFDKWDRILSQRHNVNPPTVIDTMAMSSGEDDSAVVVCELEQTYGRGEVKVRRRESCNYEKEIHSSGVHQTEGGSIKVYSDEDDFVCPNCSVDEEPNNGDQDVDLACVKNTELNTEKGTCKEEKPKTVSKRKRKTNLEKSLETAFEKFKQSSNDDFLRFQQMEEERFKRESEFRAEQMREEREHELQMMRLLLGSQPSTMMPTPVSFPTFQPPGFHFQYTDNRENNDYFEL